uniref:hypothetical protein n=1 Tax=uncultured Acinetobacter sp. TaxID=165433 RepID=UPI002635C372|nr:hypothetical protein [uncultured Acinetobacter sp.]
MNSSNISINFESRNSSVVGIIGCVLTGIIGTGGGTFTPNPLPHQNPKVINFEIEPQTFSTSERQILINQHDHSSLEVLFIQAYEKMLTESKPLDNDIAQLISDNIFDLF